MRKGILIFCATLFSFVAEAQAQLKSNFGKTYITVSDQYKEKFQEFLDKNFL